MSEALTKRRREIAGMSDPEFLGWLGQVSADMEEAGDRKGPRSYIAEDLLSAGEAVGRKINEVVDEYRSWRQAEAEAEAAEARAREMEERVRRRKRELGR